MASDNDAKIGNHRAEVRALRDRQDILDCINRYGLVCPAVPVNPLTLVLAEAFKIRSGEIHEVEAVFTVLPGLRLRGLW